MAIQDDFTINYNTQTILHTSGATIYSANALYSWIMDVFDELAQMDDPVPMSAQTPTDYTFINGWWTNWDSLKFIDGGAIQTSGLNGVVYEVEFTADAGAVAGDVGKRITDDAADIGQLIHINGVDEWYIRKDAPGTIASGSVVAVTGGTGSGTSAADDETGEDLYANIYTLGAVEAGTQFYVVQNGVRLTEWWSTGHIDILVRVSHFGVELDGAQLTVFARNWGDTYAHLEVDLSAGGRTPVPLATQADANNASAEATVEDYGDGTTYSMTIAYTAAPYSKDLNNGNGAQNYDAVIDADGARVSEVYEWLKYITMEGATTPLSTDPGTDGEQYLSADPGTYVEVTASPLGTFAGGKLFLARGIWIENYDAQDVQNFQLIDSSGATQIPPNLVSVIVTAIVSGDRVSVFPLTGAGGDIEKDTYTGAAAGNAAADPDFVVQEAITSDTPAAGYFRIVKADGSEGLYQYSSWDTSTFTLDATAHPGGLSETYNNSEGVYVPIIDAETVATSISNSLIQSTDIPVLVRVRKKGIIPFEVEGTVTATGLTVAAIRTVDSIVT